MKPSGSWRTRPKQWISKRFSYVQRLVSVSRTTRPRRSRVYSSTRSCWTSVWRPVSGRGSRAINQPRKPSGRWRTRPKQCVGTDMIGIPHGSEPMLISTSEYSRLKQAEIDNKALIANIEHLTMRLAGKTEELEAEREFRRKLGKILIKERDL